MATATLNEIKIGQSFQTEFFTFGTMASVVRVAADKFQVTYTKLVPSAIIGNPKFEKQITETRTLSMLEQVNSHTVYVRASYIKSCSTYWTIYAS